MPLSSRAVSIGGRISICTFFQNRLERRFQLRTRRLEHLCSYSQTDSLETHVILPLFKKILISQSVSPSRAP